MLNLSNYKKYAIQLVVLLVVGVGAFTAGKYSNPAKIEIKDRIVIQEKYSVDQEEILKAVEHAKAEWKKNEKVRTVTRIIYKEGQPVEKIVYVDRETSESSNETKDSTKTDETKTKVEGETKIDHTKTRIISNQPRYALALHAFTEWHDVLNPNLKYGIQGSVRLVGPLWLGATLVPQNKSVGVNLMLTQ